jgi:hypothetical protein
MATVMFVETLDNFQQSTRLIPKSRSRTPNSRREKIRTRIHNQVDEYNGWITNRIFLSVEVPWDSSLRRNVWHVKGLKYGYKKACSFDRAWLLVFFCPSNYKPMYLPTTCSFIYFIDIISESRVFWGFFRLALPCHKPGSQNMAVESRGLILGQSMRKFYCVQHDTGLCLPLVNHHSSSAPYSSIILIIRGWHNRLLYRCPT